MRVLSAMSSTFYQRCPNRLNKTLHSCGACCFNRGTMYCTVCWFVFMVFITVAYQQAMILLKKMRERQSTSYLGDFSLIVFSETHIGTEFHPNIERMKCYSEMHGYKFQVIGPDDPLLVGGPCSDVQHPRFCVAEQFLNRTSWTLVIPPCVSPLNMSTKIEEWADTKFDIIHQQDFEQFDISPDVFLVRRSTWSRKYLQQLSHLEPPPTWTNGQSQRSQVEVSDRQEKVSDRQALLLSVLPTLWSAGCKTKLIIDQPAECDTNAQAGCDYLDTRVQVCKDVTQRRTPGATRDVNHQGCVMETLWTLSNMDAQGLFHWHRIKILRRAHGLVRLAQYCPDCPNSAGRAYEKSNKDFLVYDAQLLYEGNKPPANCKRTPSWRPTYKSEVKEAWAGRYELQRGDRRVAKQFLLQHKEASYAPSRDISCCYPHCAAMPGTLVGQAETKVKQDGDKNEDVLKKLP